MIKLYCPSKIKSKYNTGELILFGTYKMLEVKED